MQAEAQAQAAAREAARLHAEARRVGPIALVCEGLEAWSKFGDEPRGGVVVGIEDKFDPETGERTRILTCLNPYKGPGDWECSFPDTEVTDASFQVPPTSRLVKLARRLAYEVATAQGNVATGRDEKWSRWSHLLFVVAMGGGR